MLSGSVFIVEPFEFTLGLTRAPPFCTSLYSFKMQMPYAGLSERHSRRSAFGICVLQARPPAIPENGQREICI